MRINVSFATKVIPKSSKKTTNNALDMMYSNKNIKKSSEISCISQNILTCSLPVNKKMYQLYRVKVHVQISRHIRQLTSYIYTSTVVKGNDI